MLCVYNDRWITTALINLGSRVGIQFYYARSGQDRGDFGPKLHGENFRYYCLLFTCSKRLLLVRLSIVKRYVQLTGVELACTYRGKAMI